MARDQQMATKIHFNDVVVDLAERCRNIIFHYILALQL